MLPSPSIRKKMQAINAHVGARMRMARKLAGMSQQQVGRSLGISYQQVQKYENGKNLINAGILALAGEVLGVSVTWFYEGLLSEKRGTASKIEMHEALLSNSEITELIRSYSQVSREQQRSILRLVKTIAKTRQVA